VSGYEAERTVEGQTSDTPDSKKEGVLFEKAAEARNAGRSCTSWAEMVTLLTMVPNIP
jgi:hypothetical protein